MTTARPSVRCAMRQNAFVAFVVLLLAVVAPASADGPDAVIGTWLTQSMAAKVQISRCGESVCGRVVWLRDQKPGETVSDRNNKDPALRSRPVMGMVLLSGFERSANGWRNGRIYNAEDGSTYRSELIPQPDGTLRVKGCVGPGEINKPNPSRS